MMVADDHVNAFVGSVGYLVNGLDAAIQCDYELYVIGRGPVEPLPGHAVTLVIAVRDIEIHQRSQLPYEGIDQCHGCGTVHIVVSIDQYLLFPGDCFFESGDRLVHILHEERVMQRRKAWTEK